MRRIASEETNTENAMVRVAAPYLTDSLASRLSRDELTKCRTDVVDLPLVEHHDQQL